MDKHLARRSELENPRYVAFMEELNHVALLGGLQEYTTFCRIWEYPQMWFQLEPLHGRNLRVLDIGSERSPFPWYLAKQGFDVIVSDVTLGYWSLWEAAARKLHVSVRKKLLDAQDLDLPTGSLEVYLSISIIEHVLDKARAISEAARVLKCGGLLAMTFDVCEPEMGMDFPAWNGRALSMREFDGLFADSPWFEPGLAQIPWNTEAIADYWAWHRTTAPHHNYVTGAAVLRRNNRVWSEATYKESLRFLRGLRRTEANVAVWRFQQGLHRVRWMVPHPIRAAVRKGLAALRSG